MGSASAGDAYSSFCVAKDDLRRCRWSDCDAAGATEIQPGQIVVKVCKFAFTSNNVTYARLGEPLTNSVVSYWQFFPAPESWGIIPVWGIGEVVATDHPAVRVGESLYGFFPMATHAVIQPRIQGHTHMIDATSHRQALPAIYQDYMLIDREHHLDHMRSDEYLVLRPAFSLSFCCALFLRQEGYFGARRIIISSASSKAALGLGFQLAKHRGQDLEICGLTSQSNVALVEHRGRYDRVYSYGDVGRLPADAPVLFVDITGDSRLVAAVHRHFGKRLVYSCMAGFTHWDAASPQESVPGPSPTLFSTPEHMLQRREEWGFDGYWHRFTTHYRDFHADISTWLKIERLGGRSGAERVYRQMLDGVALPDTGYVLSIAD